MNLRLIANWMRRIKPVIDDPWPNLSMNHGWAGRRRRGGSEAGFERPDPAVFSECRIVAETLHDWDSEEGLTSDTARAQQLPDRLHTGEKLLRQSKPLK